MSPRIFGVSLLVSPLKVEIKSQIDAVAPGRSRRIRYRTGANAAQWLLSDRPYAREIRVERHSRAAEHDRIPAITKGDCGDVAIAGAAIADVAERLLSYVDLLEARQGYVLWIEVVVRSQEPAVERGSLCTQWKRRRGCKARNPQVRVVVTVHKQRQQFQVLIGQVPRESDAVERLVFYSPLLNAAFRQEAGWPLADIGKCADALQAEAAFSRTTRCIKSLAESQVHVVAPAGRGRARHHVGGEVHASFVAAQHGDGIARIAIRRMPRQLNADLIISVTEIVNAARNVEVINLVQAAIV